WWIGPKDLTAATNERGLRGEGLAMDEDGRLHRLIPARARKTAAMRSFESDFSPRPRLHSAHRVTRLDSTLSASSVKPRRFPSAIDIRWPTCRFSRPPQRTHL